MKLKYLGPHDELDIVGVPDPIEKDAEFDVDRELGEQLLQQPTSFAPADEEAHAYLESLSDEEVAVILGVPLEQLADVTATAVLTVDPENLDASTIPDLRDFAEVKGIDLGAATLKADIVAAITEGLQPVEQPPAVVGESGPELVDVPPDTSIPGTPEAPTGGSAGGNDDTGNGA